LGKAVREFNSALSQFGHRVGFETFACVKGSISSSNNLTILDLRRVVGAMLETRDPDSSSPKLDTFIVPYEKNERFVGRRELLRKVHEMLCEVVPKQYNHRVALYGMGGVGKTQTAVAVYAHESDYERIYWISAANSASLLSGFEAIATKTRCAKVKDKDLNSLAKDVPAWLRRKQNWLIVIDNLDHIELIEGFLPARGPRQHTLITTRNSDANGIPARGLEVPLFDIHEGVEMLYFMSEMETGFQVDEAEQIVTDMGLLPLAIEQTGSYTIRKVTRSFTGFLDDYQLRRKELHEWVPRGNRQYSRSVANTWPLSFEFIRKQSPLTAALFQLLSFLNPDRILIQFVQAGKGALDVAMREFVSDSFKLANALLSLEDFSLVKWSREAKSVSIHRLLQVVVKDQLPESSLSSYISSVVEMCNIAFPAEVTNETRPLCRRYQDCSFVVRYHVEGQ
jgi:hypothetical protein